MACLVAGYLYTEPMQWITPVYEDYGVQRLRADNLKPTIARAVDPVSPYPSAHPRRVGEHSGTPRQRAENRHQGERRKGGDRRRKQVPVILDTRSSQNRRALQSRRYQQSVNGTTDTHRQRISVYA